MSTKQILADVIMVIEPDQIAGHNRILEMLRVEEERRFNNRCVGNVPVQATSSMVKPTKPNYSPRPRLIPSAKPAVPMRKWATREIPSHLL